MLRMIRYGMLAGFGFLLAVALLERCAARPGGPRVSPRAGVDGDVSEQVWQVLAEARKITEEAV
jgi:hypothetical protein